MAQKLNRWIAIVMLIVLAGCTAERRYKPDAQNTIPTHWNAIDTHLISKNENLSCIAWWRQFHDPTLNDLITKGLRHNNNVQTARGTILAAQGELKRVKLNWLPTMDWSAGYSSFPYLGFPGVLAVIVPTYTMNAFKQLSEQRIAQYELRISQDVRDGIKLSVIAQIAGNYFSLLAQIEQLQLIKHIDDDLTQQVAIFKSEYHDGLISEIPLAQEQSQLQRIKAEEQVIEQNIVIHQNMLRYLINENPKRFKLKQRFQNIDTDQLIVGSLPVNIVENRPDMRQATNELKAANVGVDFAVSNFLPTVQLSAARGDIATIANGTTLGPPIYFNQTLLGSPVLNLALFGQLQKSRGINKAIYYRYLDTLRKVMRDVNNDLSAHDYYTKRLNDTRRAKQQLTRAYRLTQKLQREGIISYSELLNEKIKLDEIKIVFNAHMRDQLITIVNLYQNLAVGYGCK